MHDTISTTEIKSSSACPICGARLKIGFPVAYGKYTHFAWECGREVDDGPGRPCPHDDASGIISVSYENASGALCSATILESESEAFLDANDHRRKRANAVASVAPKTPNELAEIEKVREGIADYMGPKIEDEIKELLKISEGVTVAGHADGPKVGREAVHTILMRFVKFRTQMIDGAHKTYKTPINGLADLLDDRKRSLTKMLEAREKQLREDRDAFDKAEEKRIADEKAERERQKAKELQNRLAAATEAGFVPDVAKAQTLKDPEWKAYFEAEAQRVAENRRLLALVKELGDLGDTCTLEEARELTVEQAAQRLEAAKVAKAERDEAERIRIETENRERERLANEQRIRAEKIESRTNETLRAGIIPFWSSLDNLADMTDDDFRGTLAEAIEAKALAKQEAEARARELEERAERLRCRTELAMQVGWSVGAEWLATANEAAFQEGLKAATEAKEQRDRDAKELEALRESARQREAREKEEKEQREADERRQREEVERRQREQAEAEQREREKPEREKAVQWLRQMEMEALVPPVFAEERINALVSRRTVDILQAIQGAMRELEALA